MNSFNSQPKAYSSLSYDHEPWLRFGVAHAEGVAVKRTWQAYSSLSYDHAPWLRFDVAHAEGVAVKRTWQAYSSPRYDHEPWSRFDVAHAEGVAVKRSWEAYSSLSYDHEPWLRFGAARTPQAWRLNEIERYLKGWGRSAGDLRFNRLFSAKPYGEKPISASSNGRGAKHR